MRALPLIAALLVTSPASAGEWELHFGGWSQHGPGQPALRGEPDSPTGYVVTDDRRLLDWHERHEALLISYRADDSRWGALGGTLADSYGYRGWMAAGTWTAWRWQRPHLTARIDLLAGTHYRQTAWRVTAYERRGDGTPRITSVRRHVEWTPVITPAASVRVGPRAGITLTYTPEIRVGNHWAPELLAAWLTVALP